MKIIDYKIITKHVLSSTNQNFDYSKILNTEEFEKSIKKYIEKGFIPLGGVSITLDSSHFILSQTLVLYQN